MNWTAELSEKQAITIAMKLIHLNLSITACEALHSRIDEFVNTDEPQDEWFATLKLGKLADEFETYGKNANEIYDVAFSIPDPREETRITGVLYRGQFTSGRSIEVYRYPMWEPGGTGRQNGWGYTIAAETGTDSPSSYFGSFDYMREFLPELCK